LDYIKGDEAMKLDTLNTAIKGKGATRLLALLDVIDADRTDTAELERAAREVAISIGIPVWEGCIRNPMFRIAAIIKLCEETLEIMGDDVEKYVEGREAYEARELMKETLIRAQECGVRIPEPPTFPSLRQAFQSRIQELSPLALIA
jgi:hypothetical protein